MVRATKATVSTVNSLSIRENLIRADRVLEGLVESSNLYRDGVNIAEISSAVIADLAEPGRPVTGNKFFGYSASRLQGKIEDTLFDPLITMMKKNIVAFPLIGRTVFTINPQNTEYTPLPETGALAPGDQYQRYHGNLFKNSVRENKIISIPHPVNQRPITIRRLVEIIDELDCIDWGDKPKKDAFALLSAAPQLAGCTPSLDMPIFSTNKFRDTNIASLRTKEHNASVTIDLGGNKPDELWFNATLNLVGGIADDEYFTEIREVIVFFEEIQ